MSGSRGARDGKAVTTMELVWGASSAHPPVLALLSAVAAQPVVDGINGSGTGPFYSVQARHVENALFTSRSLSCPTCPRTTLPLVLCLARFLYEHFLPVLRGLPLVQTKLFNGSLPGCIQDNEGKGKARGLQHSLFGGLRMSRGEFQHLFLTLPPTLP